MNKKDLETLIEQVVSDVVEQETPQDRRKQLRDKFKVQPADPNNLDINTSQGRDNVVNKLKSTFSAIATRANILNNKSANALRAGTKEEFSEIVAEMMDNTVTLLNKDYPNFIRTYSEVSKLLGLPPVVTEANTALDTPDGRRNIIRNTVNSVGKLKKVTDEANNMILNADATSNVAIFRNEIKALGNKIREIKAEAVVLDRIFTQTFPGEYQKFKGHLARTSSPPPVPAR